MSDEVDDIAELTAALRAAVKVRGLGPNSLALLEVGDCIALTPSEAEDAARALRPFVAEERRSAVVGALQDAADEIEQELICCDVFERLSAKRSKAWTEDERRELRGHAICYWGGAARKLVLDCADMSSERHV